MKPGTLFSDLPILVHLHVVVTESTSPHETPTHKDKDDDYYHQQHNKHIPVTSQPVHVAVCAHL